MVDWVGGFTGFKTAAAEELPDAIPVMDPFQVVRLAGDGLDMCRRRVQQDTLGRRGHASDWLYMARRTLHTGHALLTEWQRDRLKVLFAAEEHVEVEASWGTVKNHVASILTKLNLRNRVQAVILAYETGFAGSGPH